MKNINDIVMLDELVVKYQKTNNSNVYMKIYTYLRNLENFDFFFKKNFFNKQIIVYNEDDLEQEFHLMLLEVISTFDFRKTNFESYFFVCFFNKSKEISKKALPMKPRAATSKEKKEKINKYQKNKDDKKTVVVSLDDEKYSFCEIISEKDIFDMMDYENNELLLDVVSKIETIEFGDMFLEYCLHGKTLKELADEYNITVSQVRHRFKCVKRNLYRLYPDMKKDYSYVPCYYSNAA